MSVIDKLLGKNESENASSIPGIEAHPFPMVICSPSTGNAIRLEDIPDEVISKGILGPGCGVEPTEEIVYAPFEGTVSRVTGTKHAVGVTSAEGVELLIHVGIDTVDLNGKGFTCLVKEGQAVKAGDPLLTFSIQTIANAKRASTIAIVITNSGKFDSVEMLFVKKVQHGAPLLRVYNKS